MFSLPFTSGRLFVCPVSVLLGSFDFVIQTVFCSRSFPCLRRTSGCGFGGFPSPIRGQMARCTFLGLTPFDLFTGSRLCFFWLSQDGRSFFFLFHSLPSRPASPDPVPATVPPLERARSN